MCEEIIRHKDGSITVVKYDPSKYEIVIDYSYDEYDGEKYFVRKSNGERLFGILNCTSFIIECSRDGIEHFFISQKGIVSHYTENGHYSSLSFKGRCGGAPLKLFECQIADGSYIVDSDKEGCSMINLNGITPKYKYVKPIDYNGAKVVIISCNTDNQDTLIYGINPETSEVVTRIWSRLQRRYIDLYTKEDYMKKFGEPFVEEDTAFTLADITIENEIENILAQIKYQMGNTPEELYMPNEQLNDEFLSGLFGGTTKRKKK